MVSTTLLFRDRSLRVCVWGGELVSWLLTASLDYLLCCISLLEILARQIETFLAEWVIRKLAYIWHLLILLLHQLLRVMLLILER